MNMHDIYVVSEPCLLCSYVPIYYSHRNRKKRQIVVPQDLRSFDLRIRDCTKNKNTIS